jgi:hypothetical protein
LQDDINRFVARVAYAGYVTSLFRAEPGLDEYMKNQTRP